MHTEEYSRMHELEDRYWWFVGRRHLAMVLLRRYATQHPVVLDLGCGTGVIAKELAVWSRPVGVDMSDVALQFCRGRGVENLIQARGEFLPIKGAVLDGVLALDVFEHIDRHDLAFAEVYRALKPGGVLVLSVPAFKWLWGPHDVALMHYRRYTRQQMGTCLREAGFEVVRLSYSVFFLFPVVVLIRIIEKRKRGEAKASLPQLPGWFNNLLIRLQDLEASLLSAVNLPWGSSVIAVARKPLK